MINFHIVTIFPEFFTSPLQCGLLGKAINSGLVNISLHNPREYASNTHRHIDDAPYGGGPGMIMQAAPLAAAIRSLPRPGKILLLSPSGRPLADALARKLANETDITLICGRYEGIDARLGEAIPMEEISIGDGILNGGETASLAAIEIISRFVPGFLGKAESSEDETLTGGLLEYPQYTRPEIWEGHQAPEILLNGHHGKIASWRRKQALLKTAAIRPELLPDAQLDQTDADTLARNRHARAGRNLSFCLVHHPVKLEGKKIGTSSLTNLDVHDIARISHSYGMGPFYVLTPLQDQLDLLRRLVAHWTSGPDCDRSRALSLVHPVASIDEAVAHLASRNGMKPFMVGSSAQWAVNKKRPCPMTPKELREKCSHMPVLALLGTARGLGWQILKGCDALLRPLRFLDENHLSVRSAAAIMADRVLGDFN